LNVYMVSEQWCGLPLMSFPSQKLLRKSQIIQSFFYTSFFFLLSLA